MKRFHLIVGLAFLCSIALAQLPDVVPPSPEASGIGKYTNTPVNYYSGLADISIPIAEARSGELSVPISLSYHGGGIRVEEISSRVGLGWNLAAGGMISRSMRGIPDEGLGGFHVTTDSVQGFINASGTGTTSGTKYMLAQGAINGTKDYEPDVFNFSFPGGSGKFIIDQHGEVLFYSTSDLKVSYVSSGWAITEFKISDTNGTIYTFGGSLASRDQNTFSFSYTDDGGTGGIPGNTTTMTNYYNVWHLRSIQSQTSDSQITFNYQIFNTKSSIRGSQLYRYEVHEACPVTPGLNTEYLISETNEGVISSISSDAGTVYFDYETTERTDKDGDYALDKIRVVNGANTLTYDLKHNYFVSFDQVSTVSPILNYHKDNLTHRLKLTEVEKWDSGLTESQDWNFDYHESPAMPNRFSFAQDIWGFYNGQNSNVSLIPEHLDKTSINTPTPSDIIPFLPGAKRRPDHNFSKALSLKKVTYPTGGFTEYTSEPNGVVRGNADKKFAQTYFEVDSDPLVNYSYLPGDPTSFSQQFIVTEDHIDSVLHFTYEVFGCTIEDVGGITECGLQVDINGVSSTYTRHLSLMNDVYFRLPKGTYDLTITVVGTPSTGDTVTQAIAKLEGFTNSSDYADIGEYSVGGLRVREIASYDSVGATPIKRRLEYKGLSASTTGHLATQDFAFLVTQLGCGALINEQQSIRYSTSQVASLASGSNLVSYGGVREYVISPLHQVSDDIGYTYYTYDWQYDVPNPLSTDFPFTPYLQRDFMRGNSKGSSVYEKNTSSYILKQESTNWYDYLADSDSLFKEVKAIKFGTSGGTTTYGYYSLHFGGNHLNKTISRVFENTEEKVSTTNYFYDRRYTQPNRTLTIDSEGDSLISETFFPYDTALITGLTVAEKNVVIDMADDYNMVSVPILNVVKEGSSKTLSKQLTVYEEVVGKVRPKQIKSWDHALDVFSEDANITYTSYNKYAQIEQRNGTIVTYLWGYDKDMPVAKIVNATHAEVIAELGATTVTQIETGTYTDQALRDLINPLRTDLPNAQVFTYTYKKGIGITSVTDQNNNTTTYEYDSFNRLEHVLDQDGNLVRKVTYNLKNQ